MSEEHKCFSVSSTNYLRSMSREDLRGETIAIHYQRAPVDNGDGTTSHSLNFPILVVTDCLSDGQGVAEKVARILNEHWDDTP